MQFRLLGPFEVTADDDVGIALGGHRQRGVLLLLTLYAGEVLSVDRIAEEIWAGSPPSSAVRTVRAYVSRLRATLRSTAGDSEDSVLVSRAPGYGLLIDKSQIDAVVFEESLDTAGRLFRDGDLSSAASEIKRGLGLWRGMAIADFAYEPFATSRGQQLEERRLQAVALRIDCDLALGHHASLVSDIESVIAEHPLHERFWAQLMIALYRCGRQADALGAYTRIRGSLVEDLGIEPGPELQRIEDLVLAQSEELALIPAAGNLTSGDAAALSALTGDSSGLLERRDSIEPRVLPFVGRDAHLQVLLDQIGQPRTAARPRVVLLLGEAGCGKSRLLTEFAKKATASGALVGAGSADVETMVPFGPIADIVSGVIERSGRDSSGKVDQLRSDLAWLLPSLGPPRPVHDDDLALARTRLVESVLTLLDAVSENRSLVLIVDDAHRLQSTFLLDAILQRTWRRPPLVVLAHRTEARGTRPKPDGVLLKALRLDEATTLEVERFSDDDLAQLAAPYLEPGSDLDEAAAIRQLRERTAGIPLLVREVLAVGDWSRAPDPPRPPTALVEGIIEERLGILSPDARQFLEVAAVVGTRFDFELIEQVLPAPNLEDLLETTQRAGIVVETDDLIHYSFDHAIYCEVLIGGLSSRALIRLHARVAEALGKAGRPLDAARHGLAGYSPGLQADMALGLVRSGIDAAINSLDFETARLLAEQALSGPATELGSDAQADLFLSLGRAESFAGHFQEAESAWSIAADLVRSTGDVEKLAEVALGTDSRARVLTSGSDLRWSLLSESLEALGPGWSRTRVLVAAEWLREASLPSRRSLSLDLVEEVVAAARDLGGDEALASVLNACYNLSRVGRLADSKRWVGELRAVSERLGTAESRYQAGMARLTEAIANGEGENLDESLQFLRTAALEFGAPRALWLLELSTATCRRLGGKFDESESHASEALRIGQENGIGDAVAAFGAAGFSIAFHRGGLGALTGLLEDFAETVPEISAWSLGAGVAAAFKGDLGAATARLASGCETLTDTPEDIWTASICLAAELVGWIGADRATVERLIDLLSPFAGQLAVVGSLASDFGPTDRCLGILSAAIGDEEAAKAYFESSTRFCERLGARPWLLRTQVDELLTLRRSGADGARTEGTGLERELEASGLLGSLHRLTVAPNQ